MLISVPLSLWLYFTLALMKAEAGPTGEQLLFEGLYVTGSLLNKFRHHHRGLETFDADSIK